MLTLEQIRERLKDRNLKVVAESLELNYITITQVANGSQQNPKYQTVKALSDYLEGKRD